MVISQASSVYIPGGRRNLRITSLRIVVRVIVPISLSRQERDDFIRDAPVALDQPEYACPQCGVVSVHRPVPIYQLNLTRDSFPDVIFLLM